MLRYFVGKKFEPLFPRFLWLRKFWILLFPQVILLRYFLFFHSTSDLKAAKAAIQENLPWEWCIFGTFLLFPPGILVR
jgi:hypothetical protein